MLEPKRFSILVVDNNPFIVKTLSTFLLKEGCRVVTAENGLDALEVLRNEDIDIVFTDLVMPFVEGDVLCRIIRSKPELSHLYVVILSAIAVEARQGLLAGVPYDLCFEKGHISQMKQQVKDAISGFIAKSEGQQHKNLDVVSDTQGEKSTGITNELLSKTNYLHSILTNLNEGVIELNHQGLIIGINPAAEKFFSRSKEECIGNFLHAISDNETFNHQIRLWQEQMLSSGKGEPLRIKEDAPLFFAERVLTCEATVVTESVPAIGICIFHDITRQYHAEAHKKKVQNALGGMRKMEAMRDMAGGFAHDFNNLLTAICGNLDILRAVESTSLSERAIKIVDNTKKAAGLAVDLTKKISTFSDFGIVERKRTHIQKFLSACSKNYFTKWDKPYQLYLEKEDLWFDINPQEVREALGNIFDNSLESLDNQISAITLTQKKVFFEEPRLVSNQYIPAGEYVKVVVDDRGTGIDAKDIPYVFDPYFSNKERSSVKGLGLGLAVVYSVMRSHGGYVVVESEVGQGTQICLFFPFKHEEISTPECNHVFLIEKDEQLRENNKVLIGFLGLVVYAFASEEKAFLFFKEKSSTEDTFSLSRIAVMCDLEDTVEAERIQIRDKWRKIAPESVFIGSYTENHKPVEGFLPESSAVDEILMKPYSVPILQNALAQHGMIPFLK